MQPCSCNTSQTWGLHFSYSSAVRKKESYRKQKDGRGCNQAAGTHYNHGGDVTALTSACRKHKRGRTSQNAHPQQTNFQIFLLLACQTACSDNDLYLLINTFILQIFISVNTQRKKGFQGGSLEHKGKWQLYGYPWSTAGRGAEPDSSKPPRSSHGV